MKCLTKIGIGFSLVLALAGCKDDNDFSEIPELFFRDFQKTNSTTGVWSLGFTDGDGNIGVDVDDTTTAPNFIISIYRIDNGTETVLPDSVVDNNYRIPIVRNIPTSNGVEGEFQFTIQTEAYLLFNPPIDSMYITGFVVDRALNESNTVRTPVFETN